MSVTESKSVTRSLAAYASAITCDGLPDEVAHQGVRVIIDTLACAVHGANTSSARLVRRVLASVPASEAVALGAPHRIGAREAAFVNAIAANARDFDDNLLYFSHIANTVVPAALATAERQDADGRALVAAVVAGYEVAARVGLAMPGVFVIHDEGTDHERIAWSTTTNHSFNVIGAAVAAAHLLGLDDDGMAHAIGLAAYNAPVPSLTKSLAVGRMTLAKSDRYGWQAWSGCLAADLAAVGYWGDDTALDGPYGFWHMLGAGSFEAELALDGLGTNWWIQQTSFKLDPAGTWMRPALEAVRELRQRPSFDVDRIEAVEIHTFPLSTIGAPGHAEPTSYLDTQISYAYLVAVAALGVPSERWQDEATYEDPRLRALLARTTLHVLPEAEREFLGQLREPPHRARGVKTTVKVALADGTSLEATARYGAGDPFDPSTAITDQALNEKFERFAGPNVDTDVEALLDACWRLERGEPTRSLMDRFADTAG